MPKQNENELRAWLLNHETKQIQTALRDRVDSLIQDLANGNPLAQLTCERIALEYTRIQGEIQGLLFLDKLVEEAKDDERGKEDESE